MNDAPNHPQMSIGELARAAGVSVRTIRYYIAEGLLPPTAESGPKAAYGRSHLDRLRAIGRLKNAFLPLREIRRQLAGMDEAAIRRLADEHETEAERDVDASAGPGGDWLESRRMPGAAPEFRRLQREEPLTIREELPDAESYIANVLRESRRAPAARPPLQRPRPHEPTALETAWRRIALGDEAELLISADVYARRKDQIDALVDWARKILG